MTDLLIPFIIELKASQFPIHLGLLFELTKVLHRPEQDQRPALGLFKQLSGKLHLLCE
ncbi:hypothetical protein D3C85_1933000 [compost metagenome]